MHSIKWLVAVELYALAIYASIGAHPTATLVLAVAALIATLVALELGADLDEDLEHGLSADRLWLVTAYARLPQCPFALLAQDDGPRWRLYLPCQLRAGHVGAHHHPSTATLADAGATRWSLNGPRLEASA